MPIEAMQLGVLGLGKNEAEIFLDLAGEPEGMTAQMLAKQRGIPRATLYGYLKTLMEAGLVKKTRDDERARYWAESKEYVAQLFEEKSSLVSSAGKKFLLEMEKRKKTGDDTGYRPKLFFYDGKSSAEEVLRDILRSREKKVYWFWPIAEMLDVVSSEFLKFFHEERVRRNIFLYALWPKKRVVKIDRHPELGLNDSTVSLREIRVLPKEADAFLGYGIYGNRVGMIASKKESYGFILDSRDLSETMKKNFLYWWKRSKRLQ